MKVLMAGRYLLRIRKVEEQQTESIGNYRIRLLV